MQDDCVGIVRLKSLICHELIHTCIDCMYHAGQYRRYARKADKTYHYWIMTGDDDLFHPENPVLDKFEGILLQLTWTEDRSKIREMNKKIL